MVPGGRLQLVLMRPNPQLSFKTSGAVLGGSSRRWGGGVFLPGVGGGGCSCQGWGGGLAVGQGASSQG